MNLLIEFVNGKTLDVIPPLAMEKLVPILARISMGLLNMHRRGVFHADLKPNNIMLGKRGDVKILDYGLARIKGSPKTAFKAHRIHGARNRPHQGRQRTDGYYNFGATMYRLTTLKLPPAVATTAELRMSEKSFKALLKPVTEFNHSVPQALADLIYKCLSYAPEKRPKTWSKFTSSLSKFRMILGTDRRRHGSRRIIRPSPVTKTRQRHSTMHEQWIAERTKKIEMSGIRKVFELGRSLKDRSILASANHTSPCPMPLPPPRTPPSIWGRTAIP